MTEATTGPAPLDQSHSPADTGVQHVAPWPARAWVLAALLGTAALVCHLILDTEPRTADLAPWRSALAAGLAFAALILAFTLERGRYRGPALFAAATGLVIGGIAWRVARAGETYVDAPFWMAAGVLAGAIALPLYQAGFHRRRWATPYREAHFHVWTDAISLGGALAFTGLSWLLLYLLAELFAAIRIDLLKDLLDHDWFGWLFSGAAFGAGLGTLREQVGVLGTLQRVVLLVFSLLAVPLAAAIAIFLGAVLLSGPDVLWEATRSATPLLLAVAVGAFVLVNAVLRDSDAEMSAARIGRIAAATLALAILPLAVLAAVSMGVRVGQHGLSPERLWALVAIGVAVAYGVGYFGAVLRARRGGWDRLRQANLHLAVGTAVLALVLALPVFDFGAVSARNQIARLEKGRVTADKFDFDALRWDFGKAGRAALARLARSGQPEVAALAAKALKDRRENRYAMPEVAPADILVETTNPALRDRVLKNLRWDGYRCKEGCYVLDLGPAQGGHRFAVVGGSAVNVVILRADGQYVPDYARERQGADVLYRKGDRVEVRAVPRRMVVVNGRPVGEPIDTVLPPPPAPPQSREPQRP